MKIPSIHKFDDLHLEVISGASIALFLKLIGAGLTFGFNILLARMFGAEGTGVYHLALTVTTIATVFGRMGLDKALLRFTAVNAAISNWKAVKGIYHKGMSLALTSSSIATIIMFVSANWLAINVFAKPQLTEPIRWMAIAVIPMTLLMLHGQMLKGLKRIRDSQLVQGISVSAFSLLGLSLLGRVWNVHGAVMAYVFATIITAFLGFLLWRRATPQLQESEGFFRMEELLRSSMPLFWVASMNLLMMNVATFILGIWGTNVDVGIFSIASRTAMLTSVVLIAVNSIAAPNFAALHKQGDKRALSLLARNSTRLMIFWASPVLLVFVTFPSWVLSLFGPQFVEGATALSILAVGQFINVATGSVGALLIMSGNERLVRNNNAVGLLLVIFFCAGLIPLFGLIGAAIGVSLAVAIQNIVAVMLVKKHLNISILKIKRIP